MSYSAGLMSQHFPSATPALTQEEKQAIVSAFHDADLGLKGYLSREDLKVAVVILFGYKPSKYEMNLLMSQSRKNEDEAFQGITLDRFVNLMTSKMAEKDKDEEIRQIFLAFDSQCRGFLSVEDLHKVFSRVAPHLPSHVIESSFREIDRDGDGRISFKDFEFMMKYSLEDGL